MSVPRSAMDPTEERARTMLAQRGPILSCIKCKSFLGDKAQVEVHHLAKHLPKEKVPYLCGACGARYFTRDPLMAHLGRRHPQQKPQDLIKGSAEPWKLKLRHAKPLSEEESLKQYREKAARIMAEGVAPAKTSQDQPSGDGQAGPSDVPTTDEPRTPMEVEAGPLTKTKPEPGETDRAASPLDQVVTPTRPTERPGSPLTPSVERGLAQAALGPSLEELLGDQLDLPPEEDLDAFSADDRCPRTPGTPTQPGEVGVAEGQGARIAVGHLPPGHCLHQEDTARAIHQLVEATSQLSNNIRQQTLAIQELSSVITHLQAGRHLHQPDATPSTPLRTAAPGKENSVQVRRRFRQQDRNRVYDRFQQCWGCPVSPPRGNQR